MIQPSIIAMTGALVYEHPALMPLFSANVIDNEGEVLSHLVLSEIVQWTEDHIDDETATCESIWRWLADAFRRGDAPIQELIAVSGVEMLSGPATPAGARIRRWLSPELAELDPWPRG